MLADAIFEYIRIMAERTEPNAFLMYSQRRPEGHIRRLTVMALLRLLKYLTHRLLRDSYSVAVTCRFAYFSLENGV